MKNLIFQFFFLGLKLVIRSAYFDRVRGKKSLNNSQMIIQAL